MSHPILVTGAAGGRQGSTGGVITSLLLEQGQVRALVHKLDSRSHALRQQAAEVVEGDLLDPASVQAVMRNVKRAYFTYPVTDGLLEAATIFAAAPRDAALEFVVNNSQYQGKPGDPAFRDLKGAASFRNLQHRLADRIFDWAQVRVVHLEAPPCYENVRSLFSRSVAKQSTVFPPWGEDTTVIPLVGAQDVSSVAAALLANPGVTSQTAYALISESPTVREMIEALGRAIGRPVRYVAITDEQWANSVKEQLGPHALDHLSHLWWTFRKSGERYQSTSAIRMVTGRNPQTLEEFSRENVGSFAAITQEA
jgi:uncharacterized protein YbjT (DUF2867 family)